MPETFTDQVLQGVRVLIVEDELIVAMALQEHLEDCGCRVIGPAPHISKALSLLELETPDMAVLDLNLDGEPSTCVAEVLAARSIPFVVVTGYGDRVLDDQVLQQAPRIGKPFRTEDLVNALARMATAPGV
jgi:CheY-like chemotaxis protein